MILAFLFTAAAFCAPATLESGKALARAGNFARASEEFLQVLRKEPHNDEARWLYAVSLVRLHRNRNDLVTAENLLVASIKLHEGIAEPGPSDDLNLRHGVSRTLSLRYTYLGLVRRARLDRTRAMDAFKAAEHWDPGLEEPFLNRLAILRELGRGGEIPAVMREREREKPRTPETGK